MVKNIVKKLIASAKNGKSLEIEKFEVFVIKDEKLHCGFFRYNTHKKNNCCMFDFNENFILNEYNEKITFSLKNAVAHFKRELN